MSFFIPIAYSNKSTILSVVDDYFYLGGEKAFVIGISKKTGREKAVLAPAQSSLILRIGKVLSYCSIIVPIAMLAAKAVLRARHRFTIINPRQKMERDLDLSEGIIQQVRDLLPEIESRQETDAIQWLAKNNAAVFRLTNHPEFVFKMLPKEARNQRFNNMVKAKAVCLAHDLEHLLIPQAKKLNVVSRSQKVHHFIVEKTIPGLSNDRHEEDIYYLHSEELLEPLRELSIFVGKTGFCDVAYRNIPFREGKIALVDLEAMSSATNGFAGGSNGSCGIIGCATSEEQLDIIMQEAAKQKLVDEYLDQRRTHRLEVLANHKALSPFYEEHCITQGSEPVQPQLESFNLDLTEECQMDLFDEEQAQFTKQSRSVKTVATDVINEINRQITKNSCKYTSLFAKRRVYLNTNDYPFSVYKTWYASDERSTKLEQILSELKRLGSVFSVTRTTYGYRIQA